MHAGQFDDFDDDLPSAAKGGTNTNTSNDEEPPQMEAGLDTHRQQQTEQEIEVPEKEEAAKEGHANSGDAVGADANADADFAIDADADAYAGADAKADTTDTAVGDDDDPNTTSATEVEAAADVAPGADAGASTSDAEPENDDATELPPAFKIEIGKAIVRLQKQIKEDVLDKTHLRSIGCILGKRHKIIAPTLFKETLELPEVKDSDAATEDVKERMAKWEAVVETKNVIKGIGPHDVLFGRGGRTNIHEGNVYFRNLLQKYKMDYINASKNTKPDLSREIVYIWRNLEPVSLAGGPGCGVCAWFVLCILGQIGTHSVLPCYIFYFVLISLSLSLCAIVEQPGRFPRIQEVRSGYNRDDPDKSLPDVEVWEDVGHNRAQQKTSQCLRERNAQLRAAEGITARKRSKPPRIGLRLPTNVSAHRIPLVHRDCLRLQLQLLLIRRFHQLQQCSEPNQSYPRQFCRPLLPSLLCQWLLLPRPYRPRQCKQFIQLLLLLLLVLLPRPFHRPHTLLPLQGSFLLHLSLGLHTTFQDIPLKASLPPPGPLLHLIQPHTLPD